MSPGKSKNITINAKIYPDKLCTLKVYKKPSRKFKVEGVVASLSLCLNNIKCLEKSRANSRILKVSVAK